MIERRARQIEEAATITGQRTITPPSPTRLRAAPARKATRQQRRNCGNRSPAAGNFLPGALLAAALRRIGAPLATLIFCA